MATVLADSQAIATPLLDDRSYRLLKLPNNLHVLVIHDPTTDRAAASLDVHVGSFADRRYGVAGLAHFCEHLLFMGTAKYPQENDYSSFLAQHSGYSNAYTAAEHTNYYFQVAADHLDGALDRFAQFFIAPLFSNSCKDRELQAVDSENKKNLQNDRWRMSQLHKSTSNPQHPHSGFSTGNMHTLSDEPAQKGQNVRDVLLDFHRQQYSANLMSLVVLGAEPLDELAASAAAKFAAVPNAQLPRPAYDVPVYADAQMRKLLRARPIMDTHQIELIFPVPDDLERSWRSKPSRYFTHLLGHESKGSVLHYLQRKNWLNSLAAGGAKVCDGASVFMIDAELTPAGLRHWEDVVVHIFEYLHMLHAQEPQEWLWREMSDMSTIDFRFRQKQDAARTVSRMSGSLYKFTSDFHIPPEHLLDSSVLRDFDRAAINAYRAHLVPSNMRVCLSSQSLQDLPLREKWYGTEYSYEDIPPALMARLETATANPELHLPAPNTLIPQNFDVVGEKADKPLGHPYLVHDSPKFETWFKKDDTFCVPKGDLNLTVHLPAMAESVQNWVLGYLFSELFDDHLNDVKFFASMVGMDCSVSPFRDGFNIKAEGYSDKLPRFLETVLRDFTAFGPQPDRFDSIKYKIVQELRNAAFEAPYAQIGSNFAYLVHEKSHPDKAKLAAAEQLTYEDLKAFADNELWAKGVFVQVLIHGNFEYATAQAIQALCEDAFSGKAAISPDKHVVSSAVRMQSHQLKAGERARFETLLEDPSNVNSCLQYYIQIGQICADNSRLQVLADLFSTVVHEPCFNQLRTQEQLGYIVFSGGQSTRSSFGVRFLVQSERPCEYLEYRIDEFLRVFQATKLEPMTDDEFETFKRALADKKTMKLKNLREERARFWNAINTGYYDFQRRERDVETLASITKSEFLQFVRDYISVDSAALSGRLCVYLRSQKVPDVDEKKALVTAANNFFYRNGVEVAAEVVEEKAGESAEALAAEVDEKLRAAFVAEVAERAARAVPENYPLGDLYASEAEFQQTHEKGGVPAPVEKLSGFYYPKAHL